jgi:hypothetical protein
LEYKQIKYKISLMNLKVKKEEHLSKQ